MRLSPDDLQAHRALGRSYDAAGRRRRRDRRCSRAPTGCRRGGDLDLRRRLAELLLARSGGRPPAAQGSGGIEDLARARRFAARGRRPAPRGRASLRRAASSCTRRLRRRARCSPSRGRRERGALPRRRARADGDARGAAEAYELALAARVDAVEALVGAGNAYLVARQARGGDRHAAPRGHRRPRSPRRARPLAETLRVARAHGGGRPSYREVVRLCAGGRSVAGARRAAPRGRRRREAAAALERAIALRPTTARAPRARHGATSASGGRRPSRRARARATASPERHGDAAARYGLALARAARPTRHLHAHAGHRPRSGARADVAQRSSSCAVIARRAARPRATPRARRPTSPPRSRSRPRRSRCGSGSRAPSARRARRTRRCGGGGGDGARARGRRRLAPARRAPRQAWRTTRRRPRRSSARCATTGARSRRGSGSPRARVRLGETEAPRSPS